MDQCPVCSLVLTRGVLLHCIRNLTQHIGNEAKPNCGHGHAERITSCAGNTLLFNFLD